MIGDKENYLISAQEGTSESAAKPKKTGSVKAAPTAPRKARAVTKAKVKNASKRTMKRSATQKTAVPELPASAVVTGESVSDAVAE